MPRQFWIVNFFGLLTLCGVYAATQLHRPDFLALAQDMQAESWYRIDLADEHVGYMMTQAHQDLFGQYHFTSTTHFRLSDGAPNTITKSLIFESTAPFRLQHASYRASQQGEARTVQAVRTENGYQAQIGRAQQTSQTHLDWRYSLADFLAFETWLAEGPRQPGTSQTVKNIDFEKLQMSQRAFRTIEHNQTGYLVETNSPFAATTTQLNQNFVPVHLKMAGLFDIALVDEVNAVPTRRIEAKPHYLFPVDQRLPDHTNIATLRVQLEPPLPDILPRVLEIDASDYRSQSIPADHLYEGLHIPVGAPQIKSLLTQLDPDRSIVDALVDLTYRQLQYVEGRPADGVLDALERGYGECTDFADLLTTLARSAHLPARTIYGLAYRDSTRPAFMFHAWNEIFDGESWRAVDPTWNQTEADATHIKLTHAQSARLMHALNTTALSFQVIGFEHR